MRAVHFAVEEGPWNRNPIAIAEDLGNALIPKTSTLHTTRSTNANTIEEFVVEASRGNNKARETIEDLVVMTILNADVPTQAPQHI